jgi:hypothetical protein
MLHNFSALQRDTALVTRAGIHTFPEVFCLTEKFFFFSVGPGG